LRSRSAAFCSSKTFWTLARCVSATSRKRPRYCDQNSYNCSSRTSSCSVSASQVHLQGFCLLGIVLRLLAPQARKGYLQTLRDALATGIFFDQRLQMFRLLLLVLIALSLARSFGRPAG